MHISVDAVLFLAVTVSILVLTQRSAAESELNTEGGRILEKIKPYIGNESDVVFLLDGSGSISKSHFYLEINLIRQMSSIFSISKDDVRVAVATYSDFTKRNIDYISSSIGKNKCSLLDELNQIAYPRGGTNTKEALLEALVILSSGRQLAKKLVILLTDGRANTNPRSAGESLRNNGVEILAVGVGDNINDDELIDVATADNVFKLDSLTNSKAFGQRISSDIKDKKWDLIANVTICNVLCPDDDCCDVNANCACGTSSGKYQCACQPGYTGSGLKGNCTECPYGTYKEKRGYLECTPCPLNSNTASTGSSSIRQCHCNTGYIGRPGENCQIVKCPVIQESPGVLITKCDNSFGMTCNFKCDQNLFRPAVGGAPERTCREDGSWSGNPFTCIKITCKALSAPTNGDKVCDSLDNAVGTTCSFTCKSGFDLLGSAEVRCELNGGNERWTDVVPTCKIKTCPPLSSQKLITMRPSSCETTSMPYKSVCIYECKEGYGLRGDDTTECLATGQWSNANRARWCQDIVPPELHGCPGDQSVTTAFHKATANVLWKEPTASDNTGITPAIKVHPEHTKPPFSFSIGNAEVTYTARDDVNLTSVCKFVVTVIDDEPPQVISCPTDIEVQSLNAMTSVSWEVPTFEDNSGYVTVTTDRQPGTGFNRGEATKVSYKAWDESNNYVHCNFTVTVKLRCQAGSYLNQDTNTCQACGIGWFQDAESMTSCKQCPPGMSTEHERSSSFLECKNLCRPGTYSPTGLETCLSCPRGSYQSNYGSKSCTPCDGGVPTWTKGAISVDFCRAECTMGTYSDTGYEPCLLCPRGTYQPMPRSSVCRPCDYGQTTKNEGAVDVKSCQKIKCRALSSPTNGQKVCSSWDNSIGSNCSFKCDIGYDLVGYADVRCELDDGQAQWTSVEPSCIIKTCPPLEGGKLITITPPPCETNAMRYQSACVYECQDGYELQGNDTTECLATGQWSGTETVRWCKDIEPPEIRDCPGDQDVTTEFHKATAKIIWKVPVATDNSGIAPTMAVHPNIQPPHAFKIGQTEVTYTMKDGANLTATCKFVVSVLDDETPQLISCPPDIEIQSSTFKTEVTWQIPAFKDNSGHVTVTSNYQPGSGFYRDQKTQVSYKATDGNDNFAFCNFTVNIKLSCAPGSYLDQTTNVCEACAVGWYQDTTSARSCKQCPVGTTTVRERSTSLSDCKSPCRPGTYSRTGLETCLSCPRGTYQSNRGSTTCESCDGGFPTWTTGATSADFCRAGCPSGAYSDTGYAPCLPCPRGTYQPMPRSLECRPCSDGFTTDSTGAIDIQFCKEIKCDILQTPLNGTKTCDSLDNAIGTTCSFTCEHGYRLVGATVRRCEAKTRDGVWSGAQSECQVMTCPPLNSNKLIKIRPPSCKTNAMRYQSVCVYECQDGYELQGNDTTECLATGQWSGAETVRWCKDTEPPEIRNCPGDQVVTTEFHRATAKVTWKVPTSTDNTGLEPSMSVHPPRTHPPFSFKVGDTEVTYSASDETGLTSTCKFVVTVIDDEPPQLLSCLADIFVQSVNPTTNVSWEPPRFEDNSGYVTVNGNRQPGSYFHRGQATQVSYKASDDSNNVAYCNFTVTVELQCPPGTYLDVHTDTCQACAVGSYKGAGTATSCDKCPEETSTEKSKSSSRSDCKKRCKPGTYSRTGLETCLACPKGTYQSNHGGTSCIKCDGGFSTWSKGAISADFCKASCTAGTYSDTGYAPCEQCPRGTYQPAPLSKNCRLCPEGLTTRNEGSITSDSCQAINLCEIFPCLNGATCVSSVRGRECHCTPGYRGEDCGTNIDDCAEGLCKNNGTCIDEVNDFHCLCPRGYTGKTCQTDIDECQSNPCLNGGFCHDRVDNYVCQCRHGYTGQHCEIRSNSGCTSDPCQNGATCFDLAENFTCCCPPGYAGHLCDQEIDKCQSSPCQNGGQCTSGINTFSCQCMPGFTGQACEMNIDDCVGNLCRHRSTCLDLVDSYVCACAIGYTGSFCEEKVANDFNLHFLSAQTTDYASVDNVPDLYEFTMSFWMKTDDTSSYGTPISYAHAHGSGGSIVDNALTLQDYSSFVLFINGEPTYTDFKANSDTNWHHVTVTWESFTGSWKFLFDNRVIHSGTGLQQGQLISGGGVLVIGQEQDGVGSLFNAAESYVGQLTQLNLWDYPMAGEEIHSLFAGCNNIGNVVAWVQVKDGIHGNVLVQESSDLCRDLDDCKANPCENGGLCQDLVQVYECICPDGYAGRRCEQQQGNCGSDACKNGGSCLLQVCLCLHGFTGTYCESEIKQCRNNLCQNGGLCELQDSRELCKCGNGFTGSLCQYDINECRHDNGGCSHLCHNSKGSYSCACPADRALLADSKTCQEISYCVYKDELYTAEELWNDGCSECRCENGVPVCFVKQCPSITCPQGKHIYQAPGECCSSCVEDSENCLLTAKGILRTFDGNSFRFKGQCRYVLVQDCYDSDFSVHIQREMKRNGQNQVAYQSAIFLHLGCVTVEIQYNGEVKVSGIAVDLPYPQYSPDVVEVTKPKQNALLVKTAPGVTIEWDMLGDIVVAVPRSYRSRVCGICGNMNSNIQDDLTTRQFLFANNAKELIHSWKVAGYKHCKPHRVQTASKTGSKGKVGKERKTPLCPGAKSSTQRLARSRCSVLKSGEFKACSRLVNANPYHKMCLEDVCTCAENELCYCETIRAYIHECRSKGVVIRNWIDQRRCDSTCPDGMVYDNCGPPCPSTCGGSEQYDPICLSQPCVPMCRCPDGTVLHEGSCISRSLCPNGLIIAS
ncbi:sushi, von Willebrand factor type A, EGF and pentraxin domain-containing protein 1-like [Ptychodera flava]|uniref:sushi, von Willebrand factor type A, EGF and pentraxin domain-containing protein 1-like n=1 Tax=Ptychodera flava TaxID=63121 RepID=UPI003969D810